MRILALSLAVSITTGCILPPRHRRVAYTIDGIVAVAALAAMIWAENELDDPDPIHGSEAGVVDVTAPGVLLGAIVGACVTLLWAEVDTPSTTPPRTAPSTPPSLTPPARN